MFAKSSTRLSSEQGTSRAAGSTGDAGPLMTAPPLFANNSPGPASPQLTHAARFALNHEMFLPQRDLLSLPPPYAHGIDSSGCLPACSCMSTAASNAAVPA